MGTEFLVNTLTENWQENPDVAVLNDGSFVVVWDSFFSEDGESLYYIAAQHYSATGERIGSERIIDEDILGNDGRHPNIVALADGGYAVGWEVSIGSASDETDVYTRAFDADGEARGASARAHAASDRAQFAANLTATANGYSVSYTDYEGPDTDEWAEVFVRRFDADGRAIARAAQLNEEEVFDQRITRSTTLSNGNVVIAWDSDHQGIQKPGDYREDAVIGRIYNAAGKALTDEIVLVNEQDGIEDGLYNSEGNMDVEALSDGRFVVSWYETVLRGEFDVSFDIRAQIFSSTGRRIGAEMVVRTADENLPKHSAIAALDGGGFVIAWDARSIADPAEDIEIYARVYGDDGKARGSAFTVNPPGSESDQQAPELVGLKGGGFAIVYESEYLDGDEDSIAGRIYGQDTAGNDRVTLDWAGSFNAFGGHDRVTGTRGADRLIGDAGNDSLTGGSGRDTLDGGKGRDVLTGGTGRDAFLFDDGDFGAKRDKADVITDFRPGDVIDLSAIDAIRGGRDNGFRFIGTDAFSGRAGELRYQVSGDDTWLRADINGDREIDLQIRLDGAHALTPADFIL